MRLSIKARVRTSLICMASSRGYRSSSKNSSSVNHHHHHHPFSQKRSKATHVEVLAEATATTLDSSDELAATNIVEEIEIRSSPPSPSLLEVRTRKEERQRQRSKRVHEATVLLSCPDEKGLMAKSVSFFQELGCHILELDQHIEQREENADQNPILFQRLRFDYSDCFLGTTDFARSSLEEAIQGWASTCLMESSHSLSEPVDWSISYAHRAKRMAVFVSKESHCLFEILLLEREERMKSHQQRQCALFEIPLVVGNDASLAHVSSPFGIPFYHVPAEANQEAKMAKLLEVHDIDLVVLSNYNRACAFSEDFCRNKWKILHIYHSFLPAFEKKSCPYHSAYERGVKGIGATCHYLTRSRSQSPSSCILDGPIVEQDVVRVSHQDTVGDLMEKGRHVEKSVLLRGIKWHLEDRIHVHDNKTIVFES